MITIFLSVTLAWADPPAPTPTLTPTNSTLSKTQAQKNPDTVEILTLSTAIDRAIANNLSLKDTRMNLRIAEIAYENAWELMYLPAINLGLTSTSTTTVGKIPGSTSEKNGHGLDEHGYPSSTASVSLGSYTLYNFGKDKIVYDQAKLDWTRTKETYDESVRNLKFSVITAFWDVKTAMDKVEAANRSLEIAQAISDLQSSRRDIGKASDSDVASSKVDYLNALKQKESFVKTLRSSLFDLNILLGDPVGTSYRINEEIAFLPIALTEDTVYNVYMNEAPTMKGHKKDLKKAELSLELEEKNKLPLPKVTFSGVTVSYTNAYYGTKPDLYTSASGNSNLEVLASVSLTLPLMGPGGLFGRRSVELAEIGVDQAQLHMLDSAQADRVKIFKLIDNIRQAEKLVENSKDSYQTSASVLESVFTQFSGHAVSRLDLKDAINQIRDSEIAVSESIFSHLKYKMELATLIGVDYLPRDDK